MIMFVGEPCSKTCVIGVIIISVLEMKHKAAGGVVKCLSVTPRGEPREHATSIEMLPLMLTV